ncbi:HAD-IC family P-type ATPase [Cupriavidus sp. UGS-1]|uniref:cation-translocating P-type ATPase n=1 Tax=Cupriavidus sp. UGS-1 TaxID=2899826 RepID=UPI001E63396E|nr:HAD-IC family P-type ATPase [Cupriavidus sp. UGS-1]MCD9120644.1 HAD-IC family P-type ATPase [Cupriavidus sp. UGS-1]
MTTPLARREPLPTPVDVGLTEQQARDALERYGPNALPQPALPTVAAVFVRQFRSPLIYVLLIAALVSLALGDLRDAVFIGLVLLINGAVGTAQEYSADRAAHALRDLQQPKALVVRDGKQREIDALAVVPGDLVLLQPGNRAPADLRLLEADDLRCDESLLTGESRPVAKSAHTAQAAGERPANMVFAASMVTRGRGRGVVTATGASTELGKIAGHVLGGEGHVAPLITRLDRFSRIIGLVVAVALAVLIVVGWARGMQWHEMFMMSVGLAVSAIPEGLPVAISVALAVAMRKMARVNVIVRRMPAIEALGSCTLIATDKTGTLTLNQLSVTDLTLPSGAHYRCDTGADPHACSIRAVHSVPTSADSTQADLKRLLYAAVMPNEGELLLDGGAWRGTGDTVDVALLLLAEKARVARDALHAASPLLQRIPYEPDLRYAASFHHGADGVHVYVKGAPETLIEMADSMDQRGDAVPIDRALLMRQKDEMASRGLRVLAFASGTIERDTSGQYGHGHLVDLTFLGMAGMQDPVRAEVPAAIADCIRAGIGVVMITGDDPRTAAAIASEAGLMFTDDQICTGTEVSAAEVAGESALDRLTERAVVYARVEPQQKLAIVLSLARQGNVVAVTGDGINDAPALRQAHVGVAMGRGGTDVARESADVVLTDDNFASIVNGIREGRVAYANIRKVIFMLCSTGAAELLLFALAIPLGLPMPLLAVQLLWLNLVTNGIQDVALAAERAEGDELRYPPRSPGEPIFDRVMIRRVVHSAIWMGLGGFVVFYVALRRGESVESARNLLLLLFVLFENVQVLLSRSEHHSIFRQSLRGNPLLVASVLLTQGLHIAAMWLPGVSDTLHIAPVSPASWALLLAIAATLLIVMELEKWWDKRPDGAPRAQVRYTGERRQRGGTP